MKGETLLCEDSGLFNLPLSYSVVAGRDSGVLVYRISNIEAMEIWPTECQNEIKLKVMEKYFIFYERLLTIESSLSNKPYRGGTLLQNI